jgi:hypothetical protein
MIEIASSYLEGADREHFVVIMLDTKNQVIGIDTVTIGILASLSEPSKGSIQAGDPGQCGGNHSAA